MDKSFAEIISSISPDEMMKQYPHFKNLKSGNILNMRPLDSETQKKYTAYYARAAAEHVGFENFSPENQSAFKSAIEKIYNNINKSRRQGDFLDELANSTVQYMEDRHFTISTGAKTYQDGTKNPQATVGDNLFSSLKRTERPQGYVCHGQETDKIKTPDGTIEFPLWEIGTMKRGNEDIMIVSIPNLGMDNSYQKWEKFINTFDKVLDENREKLEKGRIILDVRGNTGGEDKPLDHMAKRLYGNMINTYKRCEIKDTALSNHFLHQHGAYNPDNYLKTGVKSEDLVERKHFSGKNQILFDETTTHYPFNPEKGFSGRLDILLDNRVGSSAESAYTSFYHHPNTRYIGENTAGMQQYTQGTFDTPWGGHMRVGVTKLTYYDKEGENIEVKGHKPDINCSGKNALAVALSLNRDEGRVIGFRTPNEPYSSHTVFAEYNPQTPTDNRKAYYARTLDPAIRHIENENIRTQSKQMHRKDNGLTL